MVSVIEMTHFYETRWSFYPLRQKHDQSLDPKCTQQDLAGKWVVPKEGHFIHELIVIGFVSVFLNDRLLANPKVEYSKGTFLEGAAAKK